MSDISSFKDGKFYGAVLTTPPTLPAGGQGSFSYYLLSNKPGKRTLRSVQVILPQNLWKAGTSATPVQMKNWTATFDKDSGTATFTAIGGATMSSGQTLVFTVSDVQIPDQPSGNYVDMLVTTSNRTYGISQPSVSGKPDPNAALNLRSNVVSVMSGQTAILSWTQPPAGTTLTLFGAGLDPKGVDVSQLTTYTVKPQVNAGTYTLQGVGINGADGGLLLPQDQVTIQVELLDPQISLFEAWHAKYADDGLTPIVRFRWAAQNVSRVVIRQTYTDSRPAIQLFDSQDTPGSIPDRTERNAPVMETGSTDSQLYFTLEAYAVPGNVTTPVVSQNIQVPLQNFRVMAFVQRLDNPNLPQVLIAAQFVSPPGYAQVRVESHTLAVADGVALLGVGPSTLSLAREADLRQVNSGVPFDTAQLTVSVPIRMTNPQGQPLTAGTPDEVATWRAAAWWVCIWQEVQWTLRDTTTVGDVASWDESQAKARVIAAFSMAKDTVLTDEELHRCLLIGFLFRSQPPGAQIMKAWETLCYSTTANLSAQLATWCAQNGLPSNLTPSVFSQLEVPDQVGIALTLYEALPGSFAPLWGVDSSNWPVAFPWGNTHPTELSWNLSLPFYYAIQCAGVSPALYVTDSVTQDVLTTRRNQWSLPLALWEQIVVPSLPYVFNERVFVLRNRATNRYISTIGAPQAAIRTQPIDDPDSQLAAPSSDWASKFVLASEFRGTMTDENKKQQSTWAFSQYDNGHNRVNGWGDFHEDGPAGFYQQSDDPSGNELWWLIPCG